MKHHDAAADGGRGRRRAQLRTNPDCRLSPLRGYWVPPRFNNTLIFVPHVYILLAAARLDHITDAAIVAVMIGIATIGHVQRGKAQEAPTRPGGPEE